MARLGKLPVKVPEGVKIEVGSGKVNVTGPKGTISRALPKKIEIKINENEVFVERKGETKEALALQGTLRAHILNMIAGVTEGWTKTLEIKGPGYRAEVKGKDLVLTVGYSHPVEIKAPEGITYLVEKSDIKVSGVDKEVVGLMAAKIRDSRRPNIYKGTGIKYADEVLILKPGKQAGGTE